jgi:GPH family glycoside/pentoside/hexuronide:cation symporter
VTGSSATEPSFASLLAYALPALPLAVLTLPLYVVVPQYYAQGLGVPLAAVGYALLLVRVIDAISDPIVGYLADKTRSRFGRRKIWFVACVPPTAMAAVMVFMPGDTSSAFYLFLWGTALSLAWTGCLVPYNAWGAELSQSYAGRNRVAAFRETIVVLGTLIAILATALIPLWGLGGDREILTLFAVMVALGLPLAALVTAFGVREPVDRSTRRVSMAEGLRFMAGNAPFLRLVSAFFLNGLSNGLPATLFMFYAADRLAAPEWRGPLLLLYFLVGILGVPLWLWLASRYGKHRVWCMAMLIACAAFCVAAFLGPGDAPIFAVICIVTGFALGADLVLPASLQADVIDVDTARSGEQRSGLYLAFWGLATKLALALAVGIAFPILAASGYDPSADLREPGGLAMLGFLYAGLPVILKLAAIGLMWRFPLGAAEQDSLRQTIAANRGAS